MNKKFTMLCASLLLASAFSVNANAALATKTAVQYVVSPSGNNQIKAIELAESTKFYLNNGTNFLAAESKKVDGVEYTTLKANAVKFSEASVFEVRGLTVVSGGVTFELYVDGKKVSVSSDNGKTVISKDEVVSVFYSSDNTTAFTNIKTFAVNAEGQDFAGASTLKAYTTSLNYKAEDLNYLNNESTTFSFNFSDEELVGNLFKDLTPVTVGSATYFLKGEKSSEFDAKTPAKIKGLQILAIDNKNDYDLNSSKAGEGLKLRMVDAEKFLLKEDKSTLLLSASDSLTLAGFTSILEADQLNNAKEIVLTMSPKEAVLDADINGDNDKNDTDATLKIAAVKTSASDTKAYVTTVVPSSSWAVVKNALLGDNTYFAASEFLKDGMRAVAILNVDGEPGEANKEYYKYIVLDPATSSTTYQPASALDFEYAQNQWVITGFDGQYKLTLTNRLDNSKTLIISNITKTENGYKGQFAGQPAGDKAFEFKLLDLSTSKNDGFLALTEEQLEEGIKLSFNGESDLFGEKVFYAKLKSANLYPTMEADEATLLKPVKNTTEVNNPIKYAYLKDGKVDFAGDTLVVPTYDIDGKTYAFVKNATQGYSLINTTGNAVAFSMNAVYGVNNTATRFNANVSRYNAETVVKNFANVNILPNVVLNESLPAVPGHYTFDNARGSINVKDLVGINEGFLASEGQVFWLDTADIEKATPSFYISFGKDSVAARNYMFNPIDSAKVFDEFTASYKYNKEYYYGEDAKEGNGTLKVAFASTVAEKGKDLADAFKFNITLNDVAVADEYVLTSVKDNALKVAQKNGVVILVKENNVDGIEPMVFTVNPAEAPTSNESVVASEVKVVANNGSVVVKNAAGKNVVVSTILGQVVANEVLTSDNATINVPAGIVVVAVDGESFKVSVK